MVTPTLLRLLRKLAIADEGALRLVMSGQPADPPLLDDRTSSLVRLAAMSSLGPDHPSYQSALEACFAAGVEDDEIVHIVEAAAPNS